MDTIRKETLVREIVKKHPGVAVRTAWTMCDWDNVGISLDAVNAAAGCVLSAARTDEELDAMTDADVLRWVASAVEDHVRRCKQSHHRRAVGRQIDRE